MDQANLKTASTYVNNLLLARGLLRNGKPVDFAQLAQPRSKKSEAGSSATLTAQVINLVHDLILRRDRDEDNQETLALTLRGLRAEAAQATVDIDRLNAQNADLKRQLALTGSTTRAVQNASQAAETSARTLREELGRVKALLAQVRQQCATDVRKRDLQLQKLRTHLASHQRGSNKGGVVAASITITGGGSSGRSKTLGASKDRDLGPSVQDIEYSLKQETTEFLTELSQSLSDENDALIGLVRGTLVTLKDLMGLPHNQSQVIRGGSQHGNSTAEDDEQDNPVQVLPTSTETLASDLEGLLSRLRDLLTNPSFAPVEEVHVRDEEIHRLREGWVLMEGRWREAVDMMRGWRKRMLESGDTVNLDDLKKGLGLGKGMDAVGGPVERESLTEDFSEEEKEEVQEDEREITQVLANLEIFDYTAAPTAHVPVNDEAPSSDHNNYEPILKEVNGNAKPLPPPTFRKVSFQSPVALENARNSSPAGGCATEDFSLDELALSSPPLPQPTPSPQKHPRLRTAASTPSLRTRPSQPRLTVTEKLHRAEAEARRRREVKATSMFNKPSRVSPNAEAASVSSPLILNPSPASTSEKKPRTLRNKGTGFHPLAPMSSPVKRTGIVGKPQRRRKSTLSPDELAALMGLRAQEMEEEEEAGEERQEVQ